MLTIFIQKVSPTEHIFRYQTETGEGETLTLESKSFLFHDFIHFAVEMEAGLAHSFFGLLTQKKDYQSLQMTAEEQSAHQTEWSRTELVVGAMTGALKENTSYDAVYAGLENMLGASGVLVPQWFTHAFFDGVTERMHKLTGEWNATPFGQIMKLEFTVEHI